MVLWTENGIRKVAAEVAADVLSSGKGAGITRKHVSEILRGAVAAEVGAELRTATEALAEDAKSTFHRKINAIYSAQREKLEQKLEEFKHDLEEREPNQQRRLGELERQLTDLETSCEEWLEAPKQELERAAASHRQAFAGDLAKLTRASEARVKSMIERAEQQMINLIQERLNVLLLEAVKKHVISDIFASEGLSNKQIAAARRISLREVKRLRRLGLV